MGLVRWKRAEGKKLDDFSFSINLKEKVLLLSRKSARKSALMENIKHNLAKSKISSHSINLKKKVLLSCPNNVHRII